MLLCYNRSMLETCIVSCSSGTEPPCALAAAGVNVAACAPRQIQAAIGNGGGSAATPVAAKVSKPAGDVFDVSYSTTTIVSCDVEYCNGSKRANT